MVNKIKVSIVVPVYNVEPFIKHSLDSLIYQTLKEIEILLIDDCSTDASGVICDEYALLDNRIKVIHNTKNIKQGLSRNIGIKKATGEYIGFLDPDDWLDLDFYEKLHNAALQHKTDIAKAEVRLVNTDGSFVNRKDLNNRIAEGIKKGSPLFVLFGWEHWTAIYNRKKIIDNNAIFADIRNGQDDLFLLRSTYYLKTISITSGIYYYYRQHNLSITSIREKPYYDSILEGFALKVDFINTHNMSKADYLFAFNSALWIVKSASAELKKNDNLKYLINDFVKEAIMIIKKHQYDKADLLFSFHNGFLEKENPYEDQEGDFTAKVYNRIINIKKKLSIFFGIKMV